MKLERGEREAVANEAVTFAGRLPDPQLKERYLRLSKMARTGQVPDDLMPLLVTMLELQGRHGGLAPSLRRVFARTEQGHQLRVAAADVNQALEALRGQALRDVVVLVEPGIYSFRVETERAHITVELGPFGARVASIETSG